MSKPKVAVVVMAHNPYQYISEFLVHHGNLVDSIYLIDHRSDKRLGKIKIDNLIHIESNQVAQFQSEVTNAVIRDYMIYENFDWIFVLDIDEFLPFKSKGELHQFLKKYNNAQTVAFNWLNGVGVYPTTIFKNFEDYRTLIDVAPLFISKKINPNIKVCVNCNNLTYPFYFRTGAHEVVKPLRLLSFFLRKNYYKSIKNHIDLHFIYHIVSFDRESFYKKIKNYVYQMEFRRHVKGQGGWMVESYLKSFNDKDWLEVIQNFRVSDKKKLVNNVDKKMFAKKDIFSHLEIKKIMQIKKQIKLLKSKILKEISANEISYLKCKKYDTDIMHNSKFFHVIKTENGDEIEINFILHK